MVLAEGAGGRPGARPHPASRGRLHEGEGVVVGRRDPGAARGARTGRASPGVSRPAVGSIASGSAVPEAINRPQPPTSAMRPTPRPTSSTRTARRCSAAASAEAGELHAGEVVALGGAALAGSEPRRLPCRSWCSRARLPSALQNGVEAARRGRGGAARVGVVGRVIVVLARGRPRSLGAALRCLEHPTGGKRGVTAREDRAPVRPPRRFPHGCEGGGLPGAPRGTERRSSEASSTGAHRSERPPRGQRGRRGGGARHGLGVRVLERVTGLGHEGVVVVLGERLPAATRRVMPHHAVGFDDGACRARMDRER